MSLFQLCPWGNRIEVERWLRIKLLLAAYAYEIASAPILTDAQFDELARLSNKTITTGKHDAWWRENFTPYTGQWIYDFPDLTGIEARFNKLNSTQQGAHNA